MNQKKRILITGGGTGGHIYPLIAIAKYLNGCRLRYFGAAGEYKTLLKNSGIEVNPIVSSKLRRYFSFLNFLDIFKFIFGFFQSLWKIYWFMPDVAFSKGGPGTLAIILACRFYFIPIVIHESDAIPGLSNRIASRWAKKVKLSFETARPYFDTKAEIEIVGQPVREEIFAEQSKEEAKRSFGLDPQRPVILILGGSQGSSRINDFILNNLQALLSQFQIIHQVGESNYPEYQNEYNFVSKSWGAALKQNYFLTAYFARNLSSAYNAADLIVSRAGAGSIFEIAAKAKPAILIPLPEAAYNHQQANAFEYQKNGAAVIIEQENLLPNLFLDVLANLLNNPDRLKQMSEAAGKFYEPKSKAAERIAANILELI